MTQPFKHDAVSLYDFFSQSGRGFYVPYYQRNYAWDDENAAKLIDDIFSSITHTLTKPNNSIFLGTIILHDEKNVQTGVHTDTPNLLTKITGTSFSPSGSTIIRLTVMRIGKSGLTQASGGLIRL